MKVGPAGSIGQSGSAAQPQRVVAGFSLGGAGAGAPAAATARTSSLSSIGPLDALLALQEVDSPLERRRRAVRRAGRILDVLDEVKLLVLDGAVDVGALDRLTAAVSEHRHETDDPRLAGVLREIEARAAVEQAKLEMARRAA